MRYIVLLIFFGLLSCKSGEKLQITWTNYNLKGKVECFSDKVIQSVYDSSWIVRPDTNKILNTIIKNYFFNNQGTLTHFEYYTVDSILFVRTDMLYSSSGNLTGSTIFENGKIKGDVKVTKCSTNYVETKTYDHESKKLNSTNVTEYDNGLRTKISTKDIERNLEQEFLYKRDKQGNEIEVLKTTKLNGQSTTSKTNIKYLKFDSIGNWTSKIEFNAERNDGCLLTIRRIKYY